MIISDILSSVYHFEKMYSYWFFRQRRLKGGRDCKWLQGWCEPALYHTCSHALPPFDAFIVFLYFSVTKTMIYIHLK